MFEQAEIIETDTVVVGGGGAALRAAIECLRAGRRTLLIMKSVAGQSHTLMAEGGINAATKHQDGDDDWQRHFDDTMESGRFINHPQMVEILCRESPDRCYDLFDFGADFRKDPQGRLIQAHARSGGQTSNRVISQGDFIGFIIQRALMAEALRQNIRILDETICVKCLVDDNGGAAGVLAYNLKSRKFVAVAAASVILACGGGGRVFRVTTNPIESTGEGYLLGLEAGIELRDMEMTQFHPTGLCWPPSAQGILVTEMCRALGGRLYNARGERFMERYDSRLELATRDIVARGIVREIDEGRGTANGGVYLDLTSVKPLYLAYVLENTARVIKAYQDLNITRERIEVRPSAHHFMGGLVARDVESMEAADNLFIAGEIAWGTHGANRLGGNSLAETQVFGFRAGLSAAAKARGRRYAARDTVIDRELRSIARIFEGKGTARANIYSIRRRLGDTMDRHAGVIRNLDGLTTAEREVSALQKELSEGTKAMENYHSFAHIFECHGMLRLAQLIIASAKRRQESRGAHFRSDFPDESGTPANTSIRPQNPQHVALVACNEYDNACHQ
jgi:succinate dehydrogenase/fumarate reductase flavoprotein subunit